MWKYRTTLCARTKTSKPEQAKRSCNYVSDSDVHMKRAIIRANKLTVASRSSRRIVS